MSGNGSFGRITVLTSGRRATKPAAANGFFIEHGDLTPCVSRVRDEIVGPIGVVIPFETEDAAVAIASDTS